MRYQFYCYVILWVKAFVNVVENSARVWSFGSEFGTRCAGVSEMIRYCVWGKPGRKWQGVARYTRIKRCDTWYFYMLVLHAGALFFLSSFLGSEAMLSSEAISQQGNILWLILRFASFQASGNVDVLGPEVISYFTFYCLFSLL